MSYSDKVRFNQRSEEVSSIKVLYDVAEVFGMFWWFFGVLSIWATYFTLNLVLGDWGIPSFFLLLLLVGIALIWEIFKHYSVKWLFADQELSTRMAAVVVSIFLVGGSMWFHFYGASLRSSEQGVKDVKTEVDFSRKAESEKLALKNKLLDTANNIVPVLKNGTTEDDSGAVGTIALVLKEFRNTDNKTNVDTSKNLLEIYSKNIDIKSDGVMYAQIIVETFLLFSLLSKFIYKANRDKQMEDFQKAREELSELLYLAREEATAMFINTALDELDGYTRKENRMGLGFIQDKINRARAAIRPDVELSKRESEEVKQEEPILLGQHVNPNNVKQEAKEDCVFECKEKESTTVKSLDLNMYDEADDRQLIRILWDNGNIHKNDFLILRDVVVLEAGEKGISRAGMKLTLLYANLIASKLISRPDRSGRYKAEVSLAKVSRTEKE